jgi:DNA (cytosine-5)-methyltransferase 1
MKIIRHSDRGLTFSFNENDAFKPGSHYRYVVDNVRGQVILIPDEDGKYKLSRKGAQNKPLVDLRNEEIKSVISNARFMEIEVLDDRIVVHIVKTDESVRTTLTDVELTELIDRSEDITFEIDKDILAHDSDALSEMLRASGVLSDKVFNDVLYVFDTVSLFSGAGLLDYPFKMDDSFDIKFAVDKFKAACMTYRENIGDHVLCMDIRELDAKDVPAADLIIGGPCCQGYSNANRTGNAELDESKRKLIDDYVRIVKEKKPLIWVIENVPQLLTKGDGVHFEKILSELSSDYHITYSVIDDSAVGGYTIRKRMVIIGSLHEVGEIVIPDISVSSKKTADDALRKVTSDWFNYSDITRSTPDTMRKMSYVRPGHNYKDIPELSDKVRHSNLYRRLRGDKPAVTITNWRKILLMPPVGNRILSVAEAAALMGLDGTFKFLGSLDDRQQQVGNGVTQHVARFIKSIVKNALYDFANNKLKNSNAAIMAA